MTYLLILMAIIIALVVGEPSIGLGLFLLVMVFVSGLEGWFKRD